MTDNIKAFPLERTYSYNEGMDLRDYFAAVALPYTLGRFRNDGATKEAYAIADEMMKARKS